MGIQRKRETRDERIDRLKRELEASLVEKARETRETTDRHYRMVRRAQRALARLKMHIEEKTPKLLPGLDAGIEAMDLYEQWVRASPIERQLEIGDVEGVEPEAEDAEGIPVPDADQEC